MSKVFKWAAGTAVVVAAAFGGWSLMKPEPQSSFITEVVKRGDISQTVSATGEISPSNLVTGSRLKRGIWLRKSIRPLR